TAKPDVATLAALPHHLIDILDPTESYSAARFRSDALHLLADIAQRGSIPLLVGGTMLYFKALREGLSELPGADPAIRAVIDAMAARAGWPALHAELRRLDPITAQRLKPSDAQRIQRALEVCYITGAPMSAKFKQGKTPVLPYRTIAVALVPGQRAILHQRIAERFEDMLGRGLIEEVEQLRRNYTLNPDLPSMRCVGYRQVWRYLDGGYNRAALCEKGIAATRQFAKRQLTWLRSMTDIQDFDCFDTHLESRILHHLHAQLDKPLG
ncbi:MAG: tRNA (adenosine(37)-N6)-dimethylallyltransferase MiaA, partial [Burkholderiales bacterium]